jgi:hypothetical protein
MIIHLSSLSSFLDDNVHTWFEERGIQVALLGSLANDKSSIDRILGGEVKCCSAFMWDSGAVSVRNKKTEITLDMYASWVRGIMKSDVPITIVGLDVIGDAEASQKNYLDLKYKYGFGNGFLPVFHYGEDIHYLEFLIQEGFTYIGLGGVGAGDRLGQESLRDWLRTVLFVDGDGKTLRYPGIKFHGFAMTSEKTLKGFPLYSVDSATWVKNSAIGKILTPFGDWRVSNDPRGGIDYQHIKRAGPKTFERVKKWVNSLGVEWEDLIDGRREKHIVNTNFFKWIEDTWRWSPMVASRSVFSVIPKDSGRKEKRGKLSLGDLKPKSEFQIVEVTPTPDVPTTEKLSVGETKGHVPPLVELETVVSMVNQLKSKLQVTEETIKKNESPVVVEPKIDTKVLKAKIGSGTFATLICPHCAKPVEIKLSTGGGFEA